MGDLVASFVCMQVRIGGQSRNINVALRKRGNIQYSASFGEDVALNLSHEPMEGKVLFTPKVSWNLTLGHGTKPSMQLFDRLRCRS